MKTTVRSNGSLRTESQTSRGCKVIGYGSHAIIVDGRNQYVEVAKKIGSKTIVNQPEVLEAIYITNLVESTKVDAAKIAYSASGSVDDYKKLQEAIDARKHALLITAKNTIRYA